MSDNGWISIHRKITGNWIWEGKPFSYGQAWIDILLECNHSERKHLIKKKLITTKRGQSSNSLQTWANRWGWSVSATRHFLDLLKIDGMCDTHNAQVTTVLTVCNYDTYQNKPHAQGTHDTSHKARTKIPQGTQGIHKQQLDNDNNGNNDKKVTRKRFTRPTYNDISIYMSNKDIKNHVDINIAMLEAEKFMNHYDSNGWKVGKNPMQDWKASVRNWLLNIEKEQEFDWSQLK